MTLSNITVILCEPQDPINIGNTIRAMKNMGVFSLRLVNPRDVNPHQIEISAPKARDMIDSLEVFDTLPEALHDVSFTAALTARSRREEHLISSPRAAAPELCSRAKTNRVALLFGREDRGLTNADLQYADLLLTIPTNPAYASLNLGQAVLLTIYDVVQAHTSQPSPDTLQHAPPTAAQFTRDGHVQPRAQTPELEGMYEHMHTVLNDTGFYTSGDGTNVIRALRNLYGRASLSVREVRIMRGIFAHMSRLSRLRQKG